MFKRLPEVEFFTNEGESRAPDMDDLEGASCYVNARHIDVVKFNFRKTSITDEEESDSIRIIANENKLEDEDINFRPLSKKGEDEHLALISTLTWT